MYNLTQEQKNVLLWLKEGNTFEVCSEYCTDQGKIIPTYPIAPKIINRTVYKLRREGLIKYQVVHRYGIRWGSFQSHLAGGGRQYARNVRSLLS